MGKARKGIRVLQKIGQGEHGSVFLVQYTEGTHKQQAALKQVTYSSRMSNDFEFSSLCKLEHPNIIRVLDYKEVEEETSGEFSLEILLEYASQGDLAAHVRKKYENNPIPQDLLVRWLCQLCLSLHYLHNDMSILHRDIKTKNILVMNNGLLKIADFGTARQLKKNQEFAMTSVGTPYYLSPEAVKGPKYNSKSDIWGLGCIMFELCTGKKPFQANNLNDLIKEILSSEIEEITEIYSEWFRNTIKSMLQKCPEKRPSIENILEKVEIRQAFAELKQQYEEYKDFIYPISELKTKKYCEREEKSILAFCAESLKTVKNQKNIKLEMLEWNNQFKYKPKKQGKVADLSKLKNRSLKSIIEKRKNQRKDAEELDKSPETEKHSDH